MEEVSETAQQQEAAPQETQVQEEPKEQQKQTQIDESQERNWKAVRSRISELEKEVRKKDELIEKALSMQTVQAPVEKVHEEPEEPDEEYVSKGKVKNIAKRTVEPLEKKIQELENRIAQQKQQELIQSLRSRYSDFDEVVNAETLNLLEEKEPELAKIIEDLRDPYKIGIQAYKYIKSSGLMEELPNKRRSKEVEKRLDKNEKTVQSPQAYEKRPMAQAFRLTEAEKSKLQEEMMHYAGMASSVPEMH